MIKIQILAPCKYCKGKGFFLVPEEASENQKGSPLHAPCPMCEESGALPKWVSLDEILTIFKAAQCAHEHISYQNIDGDTIRICNDCGANLNELPDISYWEEF